MSSFLQKLKGKGVVEPEGAVGQAAQDDGPTGVTQLPVDVYQSDNEIIIYAQIPGTDVNKLDVSIEGENDVITVQGEQSRPENIVAMVSESVEEDPQQYGDGENVQIHVGSSYAGSGGEFSFEECAWGQFFRQIILPQEVDPSHASAKVKDGVLVLHLPFKELSDNKIRMKVVKFDDRSHE